MTDHISAAARIGHKVTTPKTDRVPAARSCVGVLRYVESYSASNSRLGAAARTIMPVVAVELHQQARAANSRVGGEFPGEDSLPVVVDAKGVEDGVPRSLNTGRPPRLQGLVHGEQHRASRWISVTTGERAVRDPVVTAGGTTRRPAERRAASLACVCRFVSPLVGVVACIRAEPGCRKRHTATWDIERCRAQCADASLTVLSGEERAFSTTPPFVDVSEPVRLTAAYLAVEADPRGISFACTRTEALARTARLRIEDGCAYFAALIGASPSVRPTDTRGDCHA